MDMAWASRESLGAGKGGKGSSEMDSLTKGVSMPSKIRRKS